MIVRDGVKPLVFREYEDTVEIAYSNRGEPYREGVQLAFKDDSYTKPYICVLLDESEVRQLRDKLTEYLGQATTQPALPSTPLVQVPPATAEKDSVFGQYDHLERDNPLFGDLVTTETVCCIAAKANYGAVRLATALVRAIEKRDDGDGRYQSTLGAGVRRLIEGGAF